MEKKKKNVISGYLTVKVISLIIYFLFIIIFLYIKREEEENTK